MYRRELRVLIDVPVRGPLQQMGREIIGNCDIPLFKQLSVSSTLLQQ